MNLKNATQKKMAANVLRTAVIIMLCLPCRANAMAQHSNSEVQRIVDAIIRRWPPDRLIAANSPWRGNDALPIMMDGMNAIWYNTADGKYYRYVKQSVDSFLELPPAAEDATHGPAAYSFDNFLFGRELLLLYRVTGDKRYYNAATLVRQQLTSQPQNSMTEPFLAEYASVFRRPQDFAKITRQFRIAKQNMQELGPHMVALVDALPYYPEDDPERPYLLATLKRMAATAVRYQDRDTGLWYRTLDKPKEQNTGFDSAASCMFTYALAKGVRLDYLPREYSANAERGWKSIQSRFVQADSSNNDSNGVLLLAASEMELAPQATSGLGDKVLLDAWYNSQKRKNAAGETEYFHYKWNDYSNSGFSLFGHIFRSYGIATDTLYTPPTLKNLKDARFYIIVSPDNPSKNPDPHYMNVEDAKQIATWVKQGGVLLLMENDPLNADIPHLDILADMFGLHFNNALTHHVIGDQFETGRIDVTQPVPPFTHPHVLFMKDTCSLALSKGATPLLQWKGDTLMAVAKYGKGTVFAVTDPWLYNEYTDGRKLPAEYDNFSAGTELVRWLLLQR